MDVSHNTFFSRFVAKVLEIQGSQPFSSRKDVPFLQWDHELYRVVSEIIFKWVTCICVLIAMQIKLLFLSGFDEEELKSYIPIIHANVYETIKVRYISYSLLVTYFSLVICKIFKWHLLIEMCICRYLRLEGWILI